MNTTQNASSLIAGLITIGSLIGGARAATTVGFTNFTASTGLTSLSGFPVTMINDGVTGTESTLNGFVSASLGVITFSFNQPYELKSFLLWNDVNLVGPTSEGVNSFSLSFFDINGNAITTSAATNYIGPIDKLAAEEYVFSSSIPGVSSVTMEVLSSQLTNGSTKIEIREVDFGVVPEPSSALLMCLASVGVALHRRRNR